MTVNEQVCAITGYRPQRFPWKRDETAPGCVALRAALAEQIQLLAERGVQHFLSGMAEGVDTWAAEIVLALRETNPALKLHCILPCVGQADDWSAAAQERYRKILEQADGIRFVSREKHKDCMLERNRFMVQYATIVLAVSNGARRSGAAMTVRLARKQGREMFILNPITREITHEDAGMNRNI